MAGTQFEEDRAIVVTTDEINLLARLIQAEAEEEQLEGKIAVGAVILNRLLNLDFPDTLTEVVMQAGQFEPVANGRLAGLRKPNEECLKAAQLALSGNDPTDGALFFYNPSKSSSKWLEDKKVNKILGRHVFLA